MAEVLAFLADGSEEVECLAVVDMLRRAGIETRLVSIKETPDVLTSHGIHIVCDSVIEEEDLSAADLLFVPGGMPGTLHMGNCSRLTETLKKQVASGKRVAAICAAPSVLGALGLLEGKKATCYPGFEDQLMHAVHVSDGVVTDGLVTTARGLGFAIDLGAELIAVLRSRELSETVKDQIQYR